MTNPGFRIIGVLQLDEAKREGLTVTTRRYAVFELEEDGEGNRRFKINKPGDPLNPYYVKLSASGDRDQCTCQAALKSNWCCHIDALRSHERAGNVPPAAKSVVPSGV